MITLHHLEHSRSFRIIWALEELGIDYKIKYYERTSSFLAPDALKQVHPLGKAPILTDQDTAFAESGAILEYLQMAYDGSGTFKPKQPTQLQHYLFWLHYAEGSLMPLLVFRLVLGLAAQRAPFLIRPVAQKFSKNIKRGFIQPRLSDHVQYIEKYLADHEYLAGEFSFADIQMSFPLDVLAKKVSLNIPNIKRYLARIEERDAYRIARVKEKLETT
ncbi:glutathione S-transferase [Acinetobacter pollinis]|jgi:glutathione S-transferase|uniref:Glutathione S-transferase n=1 Tax=Acinetobacter pollinis TaxID=2605270 RepID=A0ABU6DSK9_9GAMM|nr:glutathione S-transferase [Acinetobacter pollinis]MEB5476831.1 glutathione S-transferase [Acinetobacter pollinis]